MGNPITHQLATRPSTATRLLLAAGVAAAPFFIVADLVDALTRPDYNPLRNWISHLSLGEFGWIGTTILTVTVVLLLAYAIGLLRLRAKRGYPIVVLIAAVGLGLAAAFPMDPSLGFPVGADEASATTAGAAHQAAGPIFILGLAVAAFVSWSFLRPFGASFLWGRAAVLVGIAIIVFFAFCSVFVTLDYSGVWPSAPSGLMERLAVYTGVVWTALVARATSTQLQ